MEKEKNQSISFLDVFLTRSNNKIVTSVFRKDTHSHRYLNFNSHCSLQNKKSVIKTLVNRAIRLTNDHDKFNSEMKYLQEVLLENNYHKELVQQTIHDCIAKNSLINLSNISQDIDPSKIIIIPYYRNLSEKISEILRNQGVKVYYKRGKTIGNLLKFRDSEDILEKSKVVYSLDCNDCPSVYIGMTKRKLINRINEHRNALHYPYLNSNVADHAINNNHNINFKKPKIVYQENNYNARKFLESWSIEKCKHAKNPVMNDQQNAKCIIPSVYLSLL